MATKWFAAEPVGDGLGEQIEIQTPQTPGNMMNTILTAACFAACFVIGGGAGWVGHWLFNPPSFSEAQEGLMSAGYADAAEHLGEIQQVCQNGKHTKIACRLLLLNGEEISRRGTETQISQAQ